MHFKITSGQSEWVFQHVVYSNEFALDSATLTVSFPVPIEAQACQDWLKFYFGINSTVQDAKVVIGLNPNHSHKVSIVP